MDNPFLKRATEYYRDHEAFLAVISPEPIRYFLLGTRKPELYERLVNIRGTPGSGKTTMARLFEYPALATLLKNSSISTHGALVDLMTTCGAIKDGEIVVLACRLPLETDYRDVWEFAYPDQVRIALTSMLVQARSVLGWLRHLQDAGHRLDTISIQTRPDAEAAAAAIGGSDARGLLERARSVERTLYAVVGALVAPPLEQLDRVLKDVYRPFDVIENFQIRTGAGDHFLKPLVILDDAHSLASQQLAGLQRILIRRETRVARWVLARLDVLQPKEAFEALTEDRAEQPMPGVTASRDYVSIVLQSGGEDRKKSRTAFRKMAADIGERYLRRMSVFSTRNLFRLQDILADKVELLSASKLEEFSKAVDASQRRLHITDVIKQQLLVSIDDYHPTGLSKIPQDLRLAMLSVLMHRMEKRGQASLFDEFTPEPTFKLPSVDSGVLRAAEIHLFHSFDRPFYYGIDSLCDSSGENAEQFLRLAAELVELAAVNLIRGKPPQLDPSIQSSALRKKAIAVIDDWDFSHARTVRRLGDKIADRCLAKSLEPNAPLDGGANAYGILEAEFRALPDERPELAQILKIGIANNALTVVPHYKQGGDSWCLLELGGFVILRRGLTLGRGGFIEGDGRELEELTRESAE